MFRPRFARILAGAVVLCASANAGTPALASPEARKAFQILETAPIRFEASDSQARAFQARGFGYHLRVTSQGAAFLLPGDSGKFRRLQLSLSQSNANAAMSPEGLLPTKTNYFVGPRSKWRTEVPSYRRVRATGVYPGIDLVYYGNGGRLEYDFVVSPGADPDRIRLSFNGAGQVRVNRDGGLELGDGSAALVAHAPEVYQTVDGRRVRVTGKYRVAKGGEVAFVVGSYDRSRSLVIDPVVTYSGYVRDNPNDTIVGVGTDSAGFLYVAGTTSSDAFIATEGAYINAKPGLSDGLSGYWDGYVAVLDPHVTGEASVVYSTFVGGTGSDEVKAMAVDSKGNVYLTGITNSTDFIFSGNAYQSTLVGNTDAFVAKVRPYVYGTDGLEYASLLGGTNDETGWAVAYDSDGRIYMGGTTNSWDFPLIGNSFQAGWSGGSDGVIAVFEPWAEAALSIVYTTYLGGGSNDTIRAIAVDPNGIIAVAGSTNSGDFPLQHAYQTYNLGRTDAFVTKIDRTLGAGVLLGSTILGGSQPDEARHVMFDAAGAIIAVGYTLSPGFPTTDNGPQPNLAGDSDMFVSRLDFAKSGLEVLTYSTMLGGSAADVALGACLDSKGLLYLTGYTLSNDFPLSGVPLQYNKLPGSDGFVTIMDLTKNGSNALVWSTYVGTPGNDMLQGIALDPDGHIVVAGVSGATTFPKGSPVQRNTPAGAYVPAVAVIDQTAIPQ